VKVACPGCTSSSTGELESLEAKQRSEQINRSLRREGKRRRRQVKILLLGAGESGKTTFMKQMRILHGNGFTDEDLVDYRRIIQTNVVMGLRVLCDARSKLSIPFQHPENEENSNLILSLPRMLYVDENLFQGLVPTIQALWGDSGILDTFQLKANFQISDSVGYFCDEIGRVSGENYTPTHSDILAARSATKGVSELNMAIQGVPFQFIDVGGQRSQREKWMQCFESVTSILFLAAGSEFDQVLLEDRQTNRLKEAMTIFDVIVNNRVFSNTSIIVFLNKCDLLEEKIQTTNLSTHFPDFHGNDRDPIEVKQFILNLFLGLKRAEASEPSPTTTSQSPSKSTTTKQTKPIYSHYTVAIDTENIRLIFNDVKKIILRKNLENLMLE